MDYKATSFQKILDELQTGNSLYYSENVDGFTVLYDEKTRTYDYQGGNEIVSEDEKRDLRDVIKQLSSIDMASQYNHVLNDFIKGKKSAKSTYLYIKNNEGNYQYYRLCLSKVKDMIVLTFYNISEGILSRMYERKGHEFDDITGLYKFYSFCNEMTNMLQSTLHGSIVYFDMAQFRAYKEIYGLEGANRLLKYVADVLLDIVGTDGICCHSYNDFFVFYIDKIGDYLVKIIEKIIVRLNEFDHNFEISCNFGIYEIEKNMPIYDMVDKASTAHQQIKGNYNIKYNYYTEEMERAILEEQELVAIMNSALENNQFAVYYQPQYNHSTGMLIGAEALVRWIHPEHGVISPGVFIPIFEKNGFVCNVDLFVFETTCKFIRRCLDLNRVVVPISTNISRNDIYQEGFIEKLEAIRNKYNVPINLIRVEITETAVDGSGSVIYDFVGKLHNYGYIVEIDDFGSGYSSLSVLKDIDLDVIKLDMKFLYEETKTKRGGTIIQSIIRMAKWLSMPIIAEGVEEIEQADFLKSIGCDLIQGFLYSKPIPEQEFFNLLSQSITGKTIAPMKLMETLNACDFWSPFSQETLIFSNYVGAAAILDYHKNGDIELLRVNKKYLEEIGMNLTEKEVIESNFYKQFDDVNRKIYLDMLDSAISSGAEAECESWRNVESNCCGQDKVCIRATAREIAKSDDSHLFYVMVRNITLEKEKMDSFDNLQKRFNTAAEQANIYYWEYSILTHEMKPCFRCMRDLGVPALVLNYPEPLIENGTFPADYADMYRKLMKDIDEGKVKDFEGIIPLTKDRVPFRVKYTVECDELGRPIKAFGSATLIV